MDLRIRKIDNPVRNCKVLLKSKTPTLGDRGCEYFKGAPSKYPELLPGASLNIDTFFSQLWYFRANVNQVLKKIIAIPEDSLERSCSATSSHFISNMDGHEKFASYKEKIITSHLVCALCRYVVKKYDRLPNQVPCNHLTGEAKYCRADLSQRPEYDFTVPGAFIYNCSETTHKIEHSNIRRDVYLCQSILSLKELCYKSFNDDQFDDAALCLPKAIRDEYIMFKSSIENLPH